MPVEDGVMIQADRQVLASVLENLLQNAFKFTKAWYHRHATRRRQRRARAHRGSGRMRRAAGRERQRPVSLVRTAKRRSNRLGSWPRLQPMGVEANDGQIYARNVPERDASLPSTCRGSQFVPASRRHPEGPRSIYLFFKNVCPSASARALAGDEAQTGPQSRRVRE